MGELTRVFVLLTVIVLGDCSSIRPPFTPFPLGTIGCLISDVCESGELCINDLLFGNCQSIFNRASNTDNTFELRPNEIRKLEDAILRLIETGFNWKDARAQCTLQNLLMEFRHERSFDSYLCDKALDQTVSKKTNTKMGRVHQADNLNLSKLNNADRVSAFFNSKKRDEIVQIHKYFDKSSGLLKRDPYSEEGSYIFQIKGLARHSPNELPDFLPEQNKQTDNDPPLVSEGHQYWTTSADRKASSSSNSDMLLSNGRDLMPLLHKKNINTLQDSIEIPDNFDDPNIKDIIDVLALVPGTEDALKELLEGNISPRDLNNKQQNRLQHFIKDLMQVLEDSNTNFKKDEESDRVDRSEDTDPYRVFYLPEMTVNVDNTESSAENAGYMNDHVHDDSYGEFDDLMNAPFTSEYFRAEMQPEKDGETQKEKEKTREGDCVDPGSVCLQLSKKVDVATGQLFVQTLADVLELPPGLLELNKVGPDRIITLRVRNDPLGKWNAEKIAKESHDVNPQLKKSIGITVLKSRAGQDGKRVEAKRNNRYVYLILILMSTTVGVMLVAAIVYKIRRHCRSREKLADITIKPAASRLASLDYQDLCRQRMQSSSSEKADPLHAAFCTGCVCENQDMSSSNHSSTSSWEDEPVTTNMDISAGHIALTYLEDHLKLNDRLDHEWEAVSTHVPDHSSTSAANEQSNIRKNRFTDILPYDHSRVLLTSAVSVSNADYINANFVTDHNPCSHPYICTQGPLPHTVADFWQMVWEQGCVVIVMLTRLTENGETLCHRYWPGAGSDLYHIYQVHLVSEHIWNGDYQVRNFYLKNLKTSETRTVTQFCFLNWPELSVPSSVKALLDFRRKVNKSLRGRSCPIVVHCSDGCGRSGTYCLIDMVLNKMTKGVKEIDMATTLEHIRDQRMSMVKTKEQFHFALTAVAEEVHAILRALPK